MIKILNVVGARPQIIKAAAISRTIKNSFFNEIEDIIVHTGQHYDYNMSQIFFEELEIPLPKFNMNVGSGTHAVQTAQIMMKTEEIIKDQKPDVVVVYGDTNSSLAVAITAAKMHYPVAHIEAGLRSFNKIMPEEINRIACDHVSTLLFAPTQTAINNLSKEGFNVKSKAPYHINNPAVLFSGDIMYDNTLYYKNKAQEPEILCKINNEFAIITVHREQNTEDIMNLSKIVHILIEITNEYKIDVVFPIHPRTKKTLNNLLPEVKDILESNSHIHLIEPVSYLEILALLKKCKLVLTDSGGLQKEAYFMQKPCIILRTETEWIEIIEQGAAIVTGIERNKILEAIQYFFFYASGINYDPIFGNGFTANFICEKIKEIF